MPNSTKRFISNVSRMSWGMFQNVLSISQVSVLRCLRLHLTRSIPFFFSEYTLTHASIWTTLRKSKKTVKERERKYISILRKESFANDSFHFRDSTDHRTKNQRAPVNWPSNWWFATAHLVRSRSRAPGNEISSSRSFTTVTMKTRAFIKRYSRIGRRTDTVTSRQKQIRQAEISVSSRACKCA